MGNRIRLNDERRPGHSTLPRAWQNHAPAQGEQETGPIFYTNDFRSPGLPVNKDNILTLIDKHEHIETAARALKAIAHPLRLKILCVLGEGEACVQDIVEAVGTSQSNISQHLAILRDKGVLQTRKDANRVYYRVGDQRTLQLIVLMREVFCGVAPGID
ncbi:putative transcriptional activator, ArsR family [Azoarcus olearius]|uniref:Transcriptional activator, ArsR family n=1 Tax=Azoarcus sp. (strain BH72) TaxID=418699 RepID=A1K9C0_AZOSB|nr:putative transcriptional activator, ArsR family [Azoarcus olearius]